MRLLGQSLITLVLLFLLFSNVYSQTVPYSGNNSYSLCSGTITDHGGAGNYADNANGYSVINPSIIGNLVQLTGTFSTEACCDYVRIFDGVGTGGTILYTGFGVGNIGTITSTSGSLTVQFYTDFSIVSTGFSFNIACITSCTPPANPGFGINSWNVLGYNHAGYNFANLAALTGQTFRGYYTDATVDINSQARWNTNDSPSSATPYTGCPVTFDNHTVVYRRQGFPVAQYQIDLNGHDDGVQCYVNGTLVYQIDGCCADRGVIWTGALCSTSTVEFRVMEGGGGSNLAVDFIETPWTVNAGPDGTTVCAIALNGTSSSPTFVWSPAATLSSASVLNPIATPAATTTYTLSSTLNGCTISDDVIITKNPFTITGTSSSCIGATTDLNAPETEWTALPTGGTVTTIGNERIHRFTASGTFNTSQAISNARVLVVAGGGGGGHRHAGGGGAGGVLSNNSMTIPSGAIAATIGNGGNGATAGVYGLNGGNSIFNGLTAIGGGYGSSNGQVAGIGGSGGGGSNNLLGQLGTAGQGNRGGNQGCSASYTVSGCGGACGGCYPYGSGGGGAGAQGGDSPGAGSAGGIGISNNITGAAIFYGGGGGGGLDGVIAAGLGYAGGNGGGGAGGSNTTVQGVNGTANTGGGGGGGGANGGTSGNGGNGGSGVVIVRYAIPSWTSSVPGVATINALSGVVTAVSAGTTVITYTSPSGCSTTFNFTVNPANTVAAGINRTTCLNSAITTITLATTGATGATVTGLPAGVTGTWAGNVVTISGTPTASGTFNYTVTTTGGCPPATTTGTITVNTLSVAPTAITGTTTICSGGNTTLTLSGGSVGTGATAQWYSGSCGGTFVGTGNSINVSPISNTTYFVRYSGTCNTTTCASITVTVNTLSVAPTSITGTTTICAGSSTTLTISGGTAGTGATAQWYSGSCGGTLVGTGNSVSVSPGTTTTYYVRYSGTCNTTACASVNVTVNTLSTALTIAPMVGTICPNTNYIISASGGTAGTGSTINWYTGPNGTGTFLGSGPTVTVTPSSSTTYYVRREGTCNTTTDASVTVNVKTYVYAANGATTNNYCTDNAGWHHFYTGDEIIFSVQGDLSGAPVGFPLATINDNGTFYQETEGPGTAPGCTSNQNPNEERFEMERSWNLDFGGGSQTGTYNIRFYYQPAERTAIETAAANWMATYPDCGYGYKYPNPLGFYWFKNSGSNYTAPDYDGTQYAATVSSVSGVNYAQWTGIPNFSGGSGAIILEPITTLPVELSSFAAICNETGEEVTVRWSTNSEHNSSHFTVERSFEGTDWEVVGTVNAAGNSTSNLNYELTDSDARGHALIYYRLNQFDHDSASKTYGPASAECLNDQLGFEVFPNPAGTDVTVLLHGEHQEGETEVIFTDLNGKEVKRIIYTEQVGKLMTVDLRNLEPGVYLVRLITSDTNDQFVRLIKH